MDMTDLKYGKCYWCVKTHLSKSGEIRLLADKVEILDEGTLVFYQDKEGALNLMLSLSSGRWSAVYAASMIDGHPVAVDHWEGETA